ncbi:MAG: helix-turn-helix domain-containing protein [Nocardioidaceae bacterium]
MAMELSEASLSVEGRPHPALADYVESYHGYRHRLDAPGIHHGLPSSSLTMVIAFDEPIDVGWLNDPSSRDKYWTTVAGLHITPAGIHDHGRQHGIQLELTALGARALCGVPAAALQGEMVELGVVIGARGVRLYEEVARAKTWEERFRSLDQTLLWIVGDHEPAPRFARREIAWAWECLQRRQGDIRVQTLADQVGWSRRHFSQQFRAELGIAPKEAARIMRFQASHRLIRAGGAGLAEVAAGCGFADQAHLTREWRELAGYSPTRWRRDELRFVQDGADER